jgi:hypothetical protein
MAWSQNLQAIRVRASGIEDIVIGHLGLGIGAFKLLQ